MAKQTRQVSIFINGKEVENTIKSIAAEQAKLNNSLKGMVRGTEEYENKVRELSKVNGILREHNDKLRGIKQGWDLTKVGIDNFVGIAAGAFTVDAILGYGKELFNTAVKMEALEKKARIVFAETLPAITEAAKKNATQMGLTSHQYVAAAAAIQDLLVPMGFARKQAADITTQLVNLSGALSEWTGGQVSATEVSDILAAALTGERERLKQLGIVLQQSDIDARLAEKGQAKLEGTLRQQAEAVATLDLILEKSQDAQNSYTDNADSMARRTAELTARFQEIKEALAESLIPLFEGFINIVDDVGEGLDWLAEKFDNPAWQKAAKILEPVFDPKGALIRLFSTKDTEEEDKKALERARAFAAETKALVAQYTEKDTDKKGVKQTEEEKKQAEAAAKRRKQEAERLAKEIEDLTKRTTETRLDLLAKAQDDELSVTIRAIEKRYDAEIAKALELEKKGVTEATAQRIALEQLKQEEIGLAVEADLEKAVANAEKIAQAEAEARAKVLKEAFEKDNEERAKYLEAKEEAEAEIKAFAQEALLSERELELQQLEEHYATLLAAAEEFGLDTTALKEAYAKQQADIEKGYAEKTAKELYDIQQARLAALQSAFSAFGDFVTATFDLLGGEGEKAAAFQKVATLAKIAFDTAAAISSLVAFSESNPANAVTFGAAGIAQFVAGLARILANVGQARKILSSAPAVKQKASGRYLTVTGEDDGRTYNASVIPTPYTGLLPPHPVLFQSNATGQPVLASERGAEYFVSSEALRNPYVANLTRMIDNITTGRGVAQFADGGANPATTATPGAASGATANAGESAAMMRDLAQSINTLNALLSRGIIAVVPDGTVLDINSRFKKINDVSGGYYG